MNLSTLINPLQDIKVLIAEDNEVNKLLAKRILQHWGLSFKTAHTGIEAVALIEQEDFDVVLMDIQMPEQNGIDATKAIRNLQDESKKNIPIIALTANALKGEAEKYAAAGMNGYLTKPFNEKELQTVLENVFTNKACFGSKYSSIMQEEKNKEQVYNLSLVHELAGGNADFIKSLAEIFIQTVPTDVQLMLDASEKADWLTVSKQAHKLKSTIDTMQIISLREDIRFIEQHGKTNTNLHLLPPLIQKVQTILHTAQWQLKEAFNI